MANNRLNVELLIHAGVEGLNQIERVIDGLGDTGEATAQLREASARLRAEWDSLSPEERAQRLRDLGHALDAAQSENERLNQEVERSVGLFGRFKTALLGVGATLAGVFAVKNILGFFGTATGEAQEFERQMQTVAAVSGAVGEDLEALREKAKAMGASTQYSATEAAQGLENLMRAGLSAQQAMEALAPTLALAQGNGLALGDAAAYISQAAAGMGLAMNQAGRIADVLAKAASSANTDVRGLAEALSYAAPSAQALGLSLEETVAYLGKFADAGIDGSRAGTVLNNMLSQFSNKGSAFARELHAMGIRTTNFNEALRQLAERGAAGNRAIVALGMEAAPAFKALAGQGFETLDGLKEKLEAAGGAAQEQAQTMDNSLNGALAGLSSAWSSIKLAVAEPILKPLAEQVRTLSAWLSELLGSGKMQELGERIAAMFNRLATASLGFVKSIDIGGIIDKISEKIAKWSQKSDEITGKLNILGKTFALLNIPIQALSAGIATLFAVTAEVINGIKGLLALLARGFAWVTDKLGLTTNAVQRFDDAIHESSERAGAYMRNVAETVEENKRSMLKSAAVLLDMQKQQEQAAEEQTEALQAQKTQTEALQQTEAERAEKNQHYAAQAQQVVQQHLALLADETRAIAEQTEALERSRSAFASAGLDFDELLTGVSSKSRRAFADYTAAVGDAMLAGQDAVQLARAGFEQLAASIDSPQAWLAFKEQLASLDGGLEHLTDGQLKRLEEGIKGIPNTARTAMEGFQTALKAVNSDAWPNLAEQMKKAFHDGELSAQQYAQLMQELNRKTQELQAASGQYGEQAEQAHQRAASAAREESSAKKELADAAREEKKAKEDATAASEASNASKKKAVIIGRKLYDSTNLNADAQARLNQLWQEYANDMNHYLLRLGGEKDFKHRYRQLNEYAEQLRQIKLATDALNESTQAGTVSLDDIAHLSTLAQQAFYGLDNTSLNQLNQAIDAARQKLADMKQEAEDTRASLEAQLASLRGDDSKAQALREQQRLRELQAKLQAAENYGQKDVAQSYREAIALQKALFTEERKQKAQKEEERKQHAAAVSQTAAVPSAPGKAPAAGAGISAAELAQAWDSKIEAAKREGAQNFARELYQHAKRQAR